MLEDSFARLEEQIERLVEGGFARFFAGRLHPREVAIALARALEDHAREGENGQLFAPDVFAVRLNPHDHAAVLGTHPDLASYLSAEIIEMARQAGLILVQQPEVRLLADSRIAEHQVTVSASHTAPELETTATMNRDSLPLPAEETLPQAALILDNGARQIPLDRPVVNIGRHRTNYVILDDPNVSRQHAQIRLRKGHFVLFDLGSSGGTTVNGQPVRERVLLPGDVVTLAGSCSLIYVEESPDGPPGDESFPDSTRPFHPFHD